MISFKKDKFASICLACMMLFTVHTDLNAATLHAILIGDTEDATLGTHIEKDLERVDGFVQDVSEAIAYTLNTVEIRGKNTTPDKLAETLDKIEIASEDIVVLYVSSHGFRIPLKKSFSPLIDFSLVDEAIKFSAIIELIQEKNPRFLLAIADVCNEEWPDAWKPIVRPLHKRVLLSTSPLQANYHQLFLSSQGTLLVCAAVPGEMAWSTPRGAVFTQHLIHELQQSASLRMNVSWESILDRTSQAVMKRTANAPHVQHPFFEFR